MLCLFLLNPFFYRYMGVCIPVMNCWACPAAAFACPIGAAGNLLAAGIIPLAVIGATVFCAMVAGRIFCGWVCPFGFLQDLFYKVPSPKISVPARVRRRLWVLPLFFLAATVVLVPIFLGKDSDFFFCRFCPAGTLEGALPAHFSTAETGLGAAVIAALFSWKVWILLGFLVLFVAMKRPFCRLMCPIGISLGVFNKLSFFKVNLVSVKRCPECDICCNACPVELNAHIEVNSKDCVHCYVCTESCPPRKVIKLKAKKQRGPHPFLEIENYAGPETTLPAPPAPPPAPSASASERT